MKEGRDFLFEGPYNFNKEDLSNNKIYISFREISQKILD
jgi:hypothetical protein